jgi:hypothetical protein
MKNLKEVSAMMPPALERISVREESCSTSTAYQGQKWSILKTHFPNSLL